MWKQSIIGHYRQVWSVVPEICGFSAGPIGQLPADLSVLRFPPHGNRQMWTYATCCMALPEDVKPVELHMFSPRSAVEIVEILVATAHFHRTSANLDLGHSVNFGRPWLDRSECYYGLVSLPYLDGVELELMRLDGKNVNFYWLIPISKREVEFKKKYVLESLEDEFEIAGFDYVNPVRPSVV
jgi:hypothetical protein